MDALQTFKNIQNGFILCKTPFKQLCDRWTDGRTDGPMDQRTDRPTKKWLIESRSTRLKKCIEQKNGVHCKSPHLLLAIQSLSGCAALKEEANKDANKRYKENAGRCYLFFPNSSYEWSDRSESAQTFCRVRSLTMLQSSNQFRITPWGQCRKFKFHIAYDHISNFFPAFLRILDLTLLLWRQMRKIAS